MSSNGRALLQLIEQIEDPRKPSNGTRHNFQEILVIAICAALSDNDNVEDIVAWARYKKDWLKGFLTLANGIPSEDTFLRVFRLINPKQFENVFRQWVSSIIPVLKDEIIAIDGKAVRGSGSGGASAIHMVSAFAVQAGLVLAQEKTHEKSNEITAIPALLETMYIKDLLISIDAMGCQREIAAQIRHKEADYLLAVKGNQPSLLQSVQTAVVDAGDSLPPCPRVDTTHGRKTLQITRVIDAGIHIDQQAWPDCKTIGVVDACRQVGENAPQWERRYYISSRELTAKALSDAVRGHWGIENRLHWVLDVIFDEDASTVRKDFAPQNLSLLKKMILNLLRLEPMGKNGKMSLRLKRKAAAWDDATRAKLLGLS